MEDLKKFWTKRRSWVDFLCRVSGRRRKSHRMEMEKGRADTSNMEQRTEALEKTKTGTTSFALSKEKKETDVENVPATNSAWQHWHKTVGTPKPKKERKTSGWRGKSGGRLGELCKTRVMKTANSV